MMLRTLFLLPVILLCMPLLSIAADVVLVIHGGAGTLTPQQLTPEMEKNYRETLGFALQAGYQVLKKGGSSLDAIEASIRLMEDSPLFNAGKGAVFNADGKNELDASIMDGKTMMAGSVAAVTTIKNPIVAARAVMEKSKHVMLIGAGADEFAAEQGLEIVDPSYFHTDRRWQELLREKEKEKQSSQTNESYHGTVGAVALDVQGNLAAGTSTGGRTNKRFGRVGDTPLIGAGTYANNSCAVSCTGYGEYFIRTVAAYNVCSLIQNKGISPQKAAEQALQQIKDLGGDGGMIVLDHNGQYSMSFNTAGMYRGVINANGKIDVQIYK